MRCKSFLLVAFVVSVFSLFFILGCRSDSDNDYTVQYIGWGVGTPDGVYGTVFYTQDGGTTWVRQGNSQQFADISFTDVCIIDKETVLLFGDPQLNGSNSMFKTEDGGTTWIFVGADLENYAYLGGFVLDENNIWIVGEHGTIYYITDRANSWTKLDVAEEYQNTDFLRVCAKSKDDVWIATNVHPSDNYPVLLHTTDGGVTWEKMNPLKDLNIDAAIGGHNLGIDIYGNTIWVVGGFGQYVIRSEDYGITWADITAKGGANDSNGIIVLSETDAYLITDYGGIFSTSDGGTNWTQYDAQTNNWLTGLSIINDTNIWICGSTGGGTEYGVIKYSPDGGTSWHDQTPQLFKDDTSISLYKVRFLASDL